MNSEEEVKKVTRNFPFGGLLLVLLGVIFLLNNFGVLSWEIWGILWRLWPVFLISWGIDLLLGKRFGAIISIILFVGILAILALFISQPNHQIFQNINQKQQIWREIERNKIQEKDFDFDFERDFRWD